MKIINTPKSKIIDYRVSQYVFIAIIENLTNETDTLKKELSDASLQMYFCLKGSVTFRFEQSNETILLQRGNVLQASFTEKKVPIYINLAQGSKLVIIVLRHQFVENFVLRTFQADKLNHKMQQSGLNIFQIPSTIEQTLKEIEDCKVDSILENIYLEAKTTELFCVLYSELLQKQNIKSKLAPELEVKIREISEFLKLNYAHPPHLDQICNDFGLTMYQLKTGFKLMHQHTVYGFLLDYKLELAKEDLLRGKLKVKEIATNLGYENISHFIEAFKKKFGITPKQFSLRNTVLNPAFSKK